MVIRIFRLRKNETGLKCATDILDDAHEIVHIQQYASKQRAKKVYNSRVFSMDMKRGECIFIHIVAPTRIENISLIGKDFTKYERH